MARTKTVTIGGVEYKLQSVSPSWYWDTNDKYGMTGGRKRTREYMDTMFKNCVISPPEVKQNGIAHFDEQDDIASTGDLIREIESFLDERV